MARPPLALGHHGSVKCTREDGRWVARCRVRDLDGATRRVERWGSSRAGAQRALQDELRQRRGERAELLRPESRFRDAADIWSAKITERRTATDQSRTLHWRDRNLRFHIYDRLAPSRRIDKLLDEIDDDPSGIFWG